MCLSCRNDTGSGPGLVLRRTRPDAGWRGTKSQMRRAAIPSRAFPWEILRFLVETEAELRDLDRCERSERRSAPPPRRPKPGFGEEPRNPDSDGSNDGRAAPGLPFLSRTNRLRAEGGGLARRPERCNPGYRPGGERSGAAAKLCPLNDGGEIILERPQGPRPMRAQRASVRISFWGDPRPGFPDLDRTNDGGAVRPRSCSLPSFGQRPVMHKVGGPPHPYASLF